MADGIAVAVVATGNPSTMWKHYRKTFIPMQAIMLTVVAILYYGLHVDIRNVLSVLLVMEIASIYGARWAVRLKRYGSSDDASLPLARR